MNKDTKLAMSDMVIGEGRKWTNDLIDSTDMQVRLDQLVNILMAECSDIDSAEGEQALKDELIKEYKESIRRGMNRAHKRMKKIMEEAE